MAAVQVVATKKLIHQAITKQFDILTHNTECYNRKKVPRIPPRPGVFLVEELRTCKRYIKH